MCSAVRCRTCGGTTWSGCGKHVDAVMANVPRAQRCTCPPPSARPSLLSRITGR